MQVLLSCDHCPLIIYCLSYEQHILSSSISSWLLHLWHLAIRSVYGFQCLLKFLLIRIPGITASSGLLCFTDYSLAGCKSLEMGEQVKQSVFFLPTTSTYSRVQNMEMFVEVAASSYYICRSLGASLPCSVQVDLSSSLLPGVFQTRQFFIISTWTSDGYCKCIIKSNQIRILATWGCHRSFRVFGSVQ